MTTFTIPLDRFLKLQRWVSSGGEAKQWIQGGAVCVNGEVETRRGRQLRVGDVVTLGERKTVVAAPENFESELA
jgi:ribosome-associated protein